MAQKTEKKPASKKTASRPRKAATLQTLRDIDRGESAKPKVKSKGADLTQLGRQTEAPADPDSAVLETAPNPQAGELYVARFTAPEFTSLCPVTGQPDFAHLVIDYVPARLIIESKSFKLFLTSFRNHGAFHEDCTVYIAKRIVAAAKPKWLRIAGYWYPRGGIPIDVFYQTGAPPKGVWLPETGVAPYRGRG
ncbi:preQ(1) synthase [Hyphococcus sp.]|uniref:preQ(1) synthase n=1 Tax=Hyphococcus sp. TaxID=2038636 RepID=UPI0035C77870